MSEKKIYTLVHIDSNPEAATQLQRIIRTYGLSSDFVIDVENVKSIDAYINIKDQLNTDILLYKADGSESEIETLMNAIDLTTVIAIAIANEGELEEALPLIDLGFNEVVVLSKPAVLYKQLVTSLNNKNMRDNYRELREEYRVLKDQSTNFLKSTDDAVAYLVDGMFTYFNDAFWQQMGYESEDDFLGVLLLDLIPADHVDDFMTMIDEVEAQDEPLNGSAYFYNKAKDEVEELSLVLSKTNYEGEACVELKIPSLESAADGELIKAEGGGKLEYIESLPDYVGQGAWLLNIVVKDYIKIWSHYGVLLYERYIKAIMAQLNNQFQGIRMVRYTDGSLLLVIDGADVTSIDRIGNSMANAITAFEYLDDELGVIQSDAGYTYSSLNVEVDNIPKALKTIEQQSSLIPTITKTGRIEGASSEEGESQSTYSEGENQVVSDDDLMVDGSSDDADDLGEFSILSNALEQDNIQYRYSPVADFSNGEKRYLAHYDLIDDNGNTIAWNKGFLSTVNNSVSQRLDALLISNAIRELGEAKDVKSIVINLSAAIVLNERFADTVFKTITSNERFKSSLVLGVDLRVLESDEKEAVAFFNKARGAGINLALYGISNEGHAREVEKVLGGVNYLELHPNLISRISRVRQEDERKEIEQFLKKMGQNEVKVLASGVDNPTSMAAVWEYNIPLATGTMIGSPSEKLDFDFSQIII